MVVSRSNSPPHPRKSSSDTKKTSSEKKKATPVDAKSVDKHEGGAVENLDNVKIHNRKDDAMAATPTSRALFADFDQFRGGSAPTPNIAGDFQTKPADGDDNNSDLRVDSPSLSPQRGRKVSTQNWKAPNILIRDLTESPVCTFL